MSADTPHLIGDCIDATITVTLGAPKLPLVLPPAEQKSGEVVIADIGIPHEVFETLEGPRIELLTRDSMRPLIQPRARRCAQGRLRPRARSSPARAARPARRTSPRGRAALRRRPRDRRDAAQSCLPIVAAHGAEYMTEPLEETADGTVDCRGASTACSSSNADVIAVRARASGAAPA